MTSVVDIYAFKTLWGHLISGKPIMWPPLPQKSKLLEPYQVTYLMKVYNTRNWSVHIKKASWGHMPSLGQKCDLKWPTWSQKSK